MDALLKTPADVIRALGGTTRAAGRLGLNVSQVSNWLNPDRNRIPSNWLFLVNAELAAEGKHAAPEVFRMPTRRRRLNP